MKMKRYIALLLGVGFSPVTQCFRDPALHWKYAFFLYETGRKKISWKKACTFRRKKLLFPLSKTAVLLVEIMLSSLITINII